MINDQLILKINFIFQKSFHILKMSFANYLSSFLKHSFENYFRMLLSIFNFEAASHPNVLKIPNN